MIFAVIVAAGVIATMVVRSTRKQDHRPRALELVKQLPALGMSFSEAVTYGAADFVTGNCTRCGRYWLSYCRTGECGPVHVNDRASPWASIVGDDERRRRHMDDEAMDDEAGEYAGVLERGGERLPERSFIRVRPGSHPTRRR